MLRLTRDQVVAFRAAALHLDRRLRVDQLVEGTRPCGVQDTPPGNAVLGLAARVQGLTLEAWAAAVEREKSLVELWAMRGSPIVITTTDLPYFTAGLLADDEASLLHAITSGMDVVVAAAGITATDLLDRLSERAMELLDGLSLSKSELGQRLVPGLPEPLSDRLGVAGGTFGMDPRVVLTLTVARLISLRGVFVMAPREGGREPNFVRTDQWLGRVPDAVSPIAARAELVRRCLHAFAPASSDDLAWWANPLTSPAATRANEAHAARIWSLVDQEVTEVERPDGSRGFVLTSDLSRLTNPPTPSGVRLIPPHDPFLGARDRETVVAEEHHRRLWRSNHNPGVVLSGGEVVATWTARRQGRQMVITVDSLDHPLGRSVRDAIGAEAALVAALRGCSGAHLRVAD